MVDRGQEDPGSQTALRTAFGAQKKTQGLLQAFEALVMEAGDAFSQQRLHHRAADLALSNLLCLGRQTVTGWLTAAGRQFQDWSADYRLFSHQRVDTGQMFDVVRRGVYRDLDPKQPLVVAMDDSHLPKTGRKIFGTAYRRDPLGPPFHTNLIWAQRVLQISAALPAGPPPSDARMVPIDYTVLSTIRKPRPNASPTARKEYKEKKKTNTLNHRAVVRLEALRHALDADMKEHPSQPLTVVVDNRFMNRTVLRNLPQRTRLLGRVRKDTRLFFPPSDQPQRGRKRTYGSVAPTPDQLRQDDSVPWKRVRVRIRGKTGYVQAKTLAPLLWRTAGPQPLRLVVVRPRKYRRRKAGRTLYRDPTYLICTDPDLPLPSLLQFAIWRWDIEVNFRDEKTILGVGQAQVRTSHSAQLAPAFSVANYALLLLAAHRAFGTNRAPDSLPPPKWRNNQRKRRPSTRDLIQQLRAEAWGEYLNLRNFSGFSFSTPSVENPQKFNSFASAVLYGQ